MAVLNKPENRKTNEAHDLGQISTNPQGRIEWQAQPGKLAENLLYELEMAHRILRNALAMMSAAQKNAWARKNDIDGLIEHGTTRANERGDLIAFAKRHMEKEA